ncbi:serine/threonine-protein kinase [Streptomyces purpureus]|uniref:non-specific serine/threonine protein kinase n=1 Tax=Streptomyces purpureus TaxID=1951 RepID=A0A918LW49_9ACTN|nr:serine/threonine-protein kinase [Streptomyces purpureus]GGT58578.1 serine/threonine protein kinase [Streptomyces purpureus]
MEHSQSTGEGLLLAGRYRLAESIGKGGMGRVWRAHDEVLHRIVAVKELTAGRYVSEADRVVLHARTQKEARAAARITHPGVVTVHDVLEHDSRPWIVMQYVDGPSLGDAMKQSGPIEAREAARIGLHVLRALRAAHDARVLHRDVKPANVLLARDGRVLLTDFGIAAIEGDSTITRTGEIVGSIDYLAPERVRGGDPGPASDLWSLGATLYAAVEGTSPFRRASPIETMQAVVTEELDRPTQAGPLAPVITALLSKDPADRPAVAEAERMFRDVMEGRTPDVTQTHTAARRAAGQDRRPGFATTSSTAKLPPSESIPATTNGGARRGRWRTAVLVPVVACAIGGAGVFAGLTYSGGGHGNHAGTGGTETGSPTDTSEKAEKAVKAGWQRVKDPEGFSLLVPKGWKRQMDGDQIDYTPDNGRHRIRISVDTSPDFENPFMHMLAVEKSLKKRLPDYKREKLTQNTFREQPKSCLWEFTWTEKKNHPGKRRAIDQVYYGDDGTEYALYMSSPASEWDTTRTQFDTMTKSFRPPGN